MSGEYSGATITANVRAQVWRVWRTLRHRTDRYHAILLALLQHVFLLLLRSVRIGWCTCCADARTRGGQFA